MTQQSLSLTNKLLLALVALQGFQTYLILEREAQAETFSLDYCITRTLDETPDMFVHVISHPAPGEWDGFFVKEE